MTDRIRYAGRMLLLALLLTLPVLGVTAGFAAFMWWLVGGNVSLADLVAYAWAMAAAYIAGAVIRIWGHRTP